MLSSLPLYGDEYNETGNMRTLYSLIPDKMAVNRTENDDIQRRIGLSP